MAHYRTGTININNGSTAVTGNGTDWINNASAGECLLAPDGKLYEIASIQSSTSMTLATGYQGASVGGAGQAYSIIPTQSFIRDLATQAAALVNGFGSLQSNAGAGKFGDGTVSQPGMRFSSDEDTGVRRAGSNTLAVTAGGVDGLYVGQSFVSTPHPLVSGVAQTITDWNAVTGTGWYMGNNAANTPLPDWMIGYSVSHTSDWITQEIWSFSANDESSDSKRYRREKNNGVWSSWFKVYDTDAEIKAAFNVPHTFSGGQKRFHHSPTDATWSNAQIEAYSPAGALVDFSRVAFHVQDASIAPQFGYHAGLGRAGWFATDGTPSLTWNVDGGDFQAPGEVTATNFRASSTYPNFTFAHTTGGADQKYARFAYANGQLVFERINDAYSAALSTPLVIDAAGGVTVRGGILGYGTGSGGLVSQAVSKSTAVTLNKPSGVITCHPEALAAGQQVMFIVNNSYFTQADVVVVGLGYRGSVANVNDFEIGWASESNGSFVILLKNRTGATLENAVSVAFSIIKGGTS